jgi:hypothetical protein
MPQATDEQRREWNGPGDETALAYLKEAGYTLTRRWTWLPPRGHTPTMKECSAIDYLAAEWDFGGMDDSWFWDRAKSEWVEKKP